MRDSAGAETRISDAVVAALVVSCLCNGLEIDHGANRAQFSLRRRAS